jgi:hypothetical protein
MRSWRRRGRKAQASAVAVILGLMLVVTFIANFMATTLPQQMTINDVNHDLVVENEAGRLSALLVQAASESAVGAELSQPFILGSEGLPPFAPPDGGTIGPAAAGSTEGVNFTLSGAFSPPSAGKPNSGSSGSCTVSSQSHGNTTGLSCTGSTNVVWNFSAGNGLHYSVSGTGGLGAIVNFTTSGSLITIGSVGGAINKVYVLGSNDTVYINATGGAMVTVLVVGSYDTFNLGGTGGAGFNILLVGNHDSVTTSLTGGGRVLLVGYGQYDSFTASGTSSTFTVYYTGFNSAKPTTSQCPYANSALTDTVGGSAGTVTYNDTTYTNSGHTGNASGWYYNYNNPSASNCVFVAVGNIAETSAGGAFAVQLRNTYAPQAVVGFDYGAIVLAQRGGIPLLVDPPYISHVGTSATIWVPIFTSQISEAAGAGTATLEFRLVSVRTHTWPGGGYNITPGSRVTVKITTPYAAAWMLYLNATSAFAGLASCAGTSKVCSGAYSTGGTLGTVTISLPVTSVTVEVATFSVALT